MSAPTLPRADITIMPESARRLELPFSDLALPGYICRAAVKSGGLRRVLPNWIAGDSTVTGLIPYRQGLLPSVRAFLDHLATEFPKAILM